MRQYTDRERKQLTKTVCNQCGKTLKFQNGILQEGVFHGTVEWGFFSEKDGEIHSFDLCEKCYDRLTAGFSVPVDTEGQTELL